MKNILTPFVLCLTLMSLGSLHAQHSQEISEKLQGSWEGSGTLFGQEAEFSMIWESTLNGKFLTLRFENVFAGQSGTERKMKAEAYYQFNKNTGYWFDSRGMMLPLILEVNELELTVIWGDADTERGKTVYAILNENQINVKDFVMKEDVYIQFGEAIYNKTK